MKKATRLGAIMLTLSIAFVMLALVRSGSQSGVLRGMPLPSKKWTTWEQFMAPRDLSIKINPPVNISIKIIDPSGVTLLNAENITETGTVSLTTRGEYTFSMYNPSDSEIFIWYTETIYNFEKDLLQTSAVLAVAGAVMTIAERTYSTLKHKQS